jgi:ribose 5-phosphate isomerase A
MRHVPQTGSTDGEAQKRQAAQRAGELVTSGTFVGLGTGSTVRYLLEHLAAKLATGQLRDVVGVPTSEDTEARCRALGIPLTTLDEQPRLALCIDGADEVGPRLDLIKGLGGALLREKLVARAARRFIVIADASKRVRKLGTRAPVPVEVVPFGWTTHDAFFRKLGAEPVLRRAPGGEPLVTDGGHYIVDCRFANGIKDPRALARALAARPGIVEDGLFLGMAHAACIATPRGVTMITRRR